MLNSRSLLVCLAPLLVLLSVKSLSAGDQIDSVHVGQRVRVHIDTVISERFMLFFSLKHDETRKIVGHLDSYTNDSITVVRDFPQAERRMISTESIKRIDYSTGIRRATWKGLWKGAASATAFFAMWGGVIAVSQPDSVNWWGVAGFIGGWTLVGGLIGWSSHHDTWTEVKKDKLPWGVDVEVADGGLQLRFSLSFP